MKSGSPRFKETLHSRTSTCGLLLHSEDPGDRGKTYDLVIPWHSILYIEMDSEGTHAPYGR